MVNKTEIAQLQRKIGHDFKDESLLKLALTHRSAGKKHNERIEFLGDSILSFIIAEELYSRYPGASEGDMSRLRATLVRGKTLAEMGREFGVGNCIFLGPGEMKSGGARRDSILEDVMESIIGAIYLDTDMDTVKALVLHWYQSRLEKFKPGQSQKDPKTQLQEFLQGRKKALPVYTVVEITGEAHDQKFYVECVVQGIKMPFNGEGFSRRAAEQQAAQEALDTLKKKSKKKNLNDKRD